MGQAIGIIETLGLAAAIEAADTAVKSANVRLIGYEKTKGGGWMTVKFTGDVGAVKAAVTSGSLAAAKVNQVISTLVLARPHQDLEPLIHAEDNVPGLEKTLTAPEATPQDLQQETRQPEAETAAEPDPPMEPEFENAEPAQNTPGAPGTCNLCGDPLCPRRKGEPRSKCIHN